MIKFEEGYDQKEFIYFRTKDQGDMYLRDERPYIDLCIVNIAKGGVTNDTLSWNANWNFKVTQRFLGLPNNDKYVREIKCNVLYRDWKSITRYIHNKNLFFDVFQQVFE